MFVKPGLHREIPGALLRVRVPHTHALLNEGGEEVPENRFWLRRLRQGDVVRAEPPAPPAVPLQQPVPDVQGEQAPATAPVAVAPAEAPQVVHPADHS